MKIKYNYSKVEGDNLYFSLRLIILIFIYKSTHKIWSWLDDWLGLEEALVHESIMPIDDKEVHVMI